jgi:hemoglobin
VETGNRLGFVVLYAETWPGRKHPPAVDSGWRRQEESFGDWRAARNWLATRLRPGAHRVVTTAAPARRAGAAVQHHGEEYVGGQERQGRQGRWSLRHALSSDLRAERWLLSQPVEQARIVTCPVTMAGDATLFDRAGRESGLARWVTRFQDQLLIDQRTAHYFAMADTRAIARHQVALLGMVTGSQRSYAGRDMAAAHADLDITRDDFDVVLWHLATSGQAARVSQDVIDAVVAAVEEFRPAICRDPR